MRTVWFALFDTTIDEVEGHLSRAGFDGPHNESYRWYYPAGERAILYLDVEDYGWVEKYQLHDEYAELIQSVGGSEPTVHVSADVSGRYSGDNETRFLAKTLLNRFKGYAFDDYLSYSHAWSLDEIESSMKVNGLYFFDYKGHYEKNKLK